LANGKNIVSFKSNSWVYITSASSGIWTMWALMEAIGFVILQRKSRYGKYSALLHVF